MYGVPVLGLNMRIGLHHGQFVAGVIGSNQLRFDIWGEDVLIGNQMESSGHWSAFKVLSWRRGGPTY